MARLVDIRPGERRPALAAFFALLGLTAAHMLLETARDALFLAKLPASRLPWVYLAIAGAGLALAQLSRRRSASQSRRLAVPIALIASAAINLAFFGLGAAGSTGDAMLYALYVWSGIFGSWVVVQFWLLLGGSFTVAQAKRLYGFIGAGSVLGAVGGAAAARALAGALPAQHLLVASSALLIVTALGPAMLVSPRPSTNELPEPRPEAAPKRSSFGEDLRLLLDDPYTRRLLMLVAVGTVAVTSVDYLFKDAVAKAVPPERLGAYFADVYVVLNSIALVVQLFGVGWVLRTFGVHRAIWIMPVLILLGGGGVLVGGGLAAALVVKGADGAFRHSLNRTTTELLYVPLSDSVRARTKPQVDLLGQRGGQALASILILTIVALGAEQVHLAAMIVLLAAGWLWAARGMRALYLDLFRVTLREGRIFDDREDLPDLDLGALEALFTALNSKKDAEVIGALELLAAQKRQRLIPALILYHPSRMIVLRALELFMREGRTDFVPIADRLLSHADPEIRAAALRARAKVEPDESFLRARLDDACLEVRATALISLLSRGWMTKEEGDRALSQLVRDPSSALKIALARAIGQQPSQELIPPLLELLESPDPEVQMEVAWALGKTKDEALIPRLVGLLAQRLPGSASRDALAEIGPAALVHLDRTLEDPGVPEDVRWAVPRALSAFPPALSAPILLAHLAKTSDGMLRYRILRALKRLRTTAPALELDPKLLSSVAEETTRRAAQLLAWRVGLEAGAAKSAARRTPAFELIVTLLRDKEAHAIGRLFRLFGLLHPEESFERIHRGLLNKNAKMRASARELIENVVAPPLRNAVLALIEDLPDAERLTRVPEPYRAAPVEADALIRTLLSRADELGALAAHHALEIGLDVDSSLVRRSFSGALGAGLPKSAPPPALEGDRS